MVQSSLDIDCSYFHTIEICNSMLINGIAFLNPRLARNVESENESTLKVN